MSKGSPDWKAGTAVVGRKDQPELDAIRIEQPFDAISLLD